MSPAFIELASRMCAGLPKVVPLSLVVSKMGWGKAYLDNRKSSGKFKFLIMTDEIGVPTTRQQVVLRDAVATLLAYGYYERARDTVGEVRKAYVEAS